MFSIETKDCKDFVEKLDLWKMHLEILDVSLQHKS